MKVLIACEFSGVVRNAFLNRGHDAWSCDLLPSEDGSNRHIQDDIRNVMYMDDWDLMMVAHPPCTRLCNSGVRWLKKPPPGKTVRDMVKELREGANLFSELWNSEIPKIAVENPIMHKYAKKRIKNYCDYSQKIQPWQFGHDPNGADNVSKATCLWLKNLPKLELTGTLDGSSARNDIHHCPPGPDRWKIRSTFFPGIAKAMAEQWG